MGKGARKESSTSTFESLLQELIDATRTNRDKGTQFERLIANYLVTDPQYADRLSDVWLWDEWPDRWSVDVGIDIVARERGTGDYWAIQCKFYDPEHTLQKSDIDSFFTASGKQFATSDGKKSFTTRMVVSTTDKWSKLAEDAMANQSIPVVRLWFKDLADSPIDWSQFSLSRVKDIHLKPKKELRDDQREAVDSIISGFKTSDRGKLIMACGTGKTLTSLRLAEEISKKSGRILFLAPSISLVAQTLREWTAEAMTPIHAFVVCSDTKVGKDEEDIRTHDLAYPATTNARKLVLASEAVSKGRRTVIFSTYHSIQVITDAQKQGLGEFDLIICDEAHRTTGLTLPDEDPSEFVKVHDNHLVKARKRIYMTATPRIYTDASKTRASEGDAILYSMDDLETYGPEFFRLGFRKAVDLNLLSDYKVLIVAVEENKMAKLANAYNNAYKVDDKKAVDIRLATKIVGSWKGLSKQGLVLIGDDGQQEALTDDVDEPMRRAVAFSKSIKDSRQTTDIFAKLVEMYQQAHPDETEIHMVHCDLDHVDGSMNALKRQNALDWLKENPGKGNCRILSNARCLSEGIDVPALDSVIFFDTRESIVDIVQSVGRVMRKVDGKKYGYIILPVCMPSGKAGEYNSYIESDPQFKGVWKVIKALRAHDESLVDEAEFRRRIKVIGESKKSGEDWGENTSLPLDFPVLPLDEISDAVYAAIPRKLGDREYWAEWAKSISTVALRLIARIKSLIEHDQNLAREFDIFLKGLQDTLNPAVTADDAIEMLAQHILTLPVFQALFADTNFPEKNVVGKALQVIVNKLDASAVASETEGLDKFYANVRERISLVKSDKSKQDVIRNLYDTFFNNAFPRMAERLGIVYTPIEIIDFILNSVQYALQKHFNCSIGDKDVQILDPFSGTGTFLVRLIQSGLINKDDLIYKYANEMHANEIVLLAYYIATINIETAYHAQTGEYQPFNGMILIDTFQMTEKNDLVDRVVLPENNERAERQLAQPIRVIVSNPPYSAGQSSANENNQNLKYPTLDARIRTTYAAKSSATNKNSLYDSYIRAIRWASDRIGDNGIVAFVTNGSFIDGNAADGLRKCLTEEYSHLYIFNLRGNARTQGEERKKESGGVFGEGSRTPVAISIMIKNPAHKGQCELCYYDIGDYLSREEKLGIVENFENIDNIVWQPLQPNQEGDWINQRDPSFATFIDIKQLFVCKSRGLETARDAWVYNYSPKLLIDNMSRMTNFYNKEVERYKTINKNTSQKPDIGSFVDNDPKKISWSSSLLPNVSRGKKAEFDPSKITISMYRPFEKQWLYFDGMMNHRVGQWPVILPSKDHTNLIISVTGIGATKTFSVLATKTTPDLEMVSKGQCFPLYWYEKADKSKRPNDDLFDAGKVDEHGYIRHDAITDWALSTFQMQYNDKSITKEDIFWYVYGILHSPEYKQRFAADLKKMLPRIPFTKDFRAFSAAGKALGEWHLNYESVEPYPLTEEKKRLVMEADDYRVTKMTFGKKAGKPDKTVIVYNQNLTLRDIPLDAYDYVVNGKPAIEWIMDRYQVTVDKASGIKNDPNHWSEDPRYIVDLLKRIVRVSIESVRIVKGLPGLEEVK